MITTLVQGDTPTWTDGPYTNAQGKVLDASAYGLRYTLAGPPAAPLVLTASAVGTSWSTTISTAQSAALTVGTYWWTAQLFATGYQLTIGSGEILVQPNLTTLSATYDGRTVAEKALAAAETALSVFQASGGRTKGYTIGGRQMQFQSDTEIIAVVNYWRARVVAESFAANGAKNRNIRARFQRAG